MTPIFALHARLTRRGGPRQKERQRIGSAYRISTAAQIRLRSPAGFTLKAANENCPTESIA